MTATMTTATIWGTDAWIDMWSGFRHPLQEPGTLPERVQNVFSYNLTVNFPLITEICELAEQRPYEIAEMLRILASALRENANSKLKVLTLLNELTYNEFVIYAVKDCRQLVPLLRQCQQFYGDPAEGPAVADNIRMFSCEIERKVRSEMGKPPPKVKPRHFDQSFARSSMTGSGDAAFGHNISKDSNVGRQQPPPNPMTNGIATASSGPSINPIAGVPQAPMNSIPGAPQPPMNSMPGAPQPPMNSMLGAPQPPMNPIPGAPQPPMNSIPSAPQPPMNPIPSVSPIDSAQPLSGDSTINMVSGQSSKVGHLNTVNTNNMGQSAVSTNGTEKSPMSHSTASFGSRSRPVPSPIHTTIDPFGNTISPEATPTTAQPAAGTAPEQPGIAPQQQQVSSTAFGNHLQDQTSTTSVPLGGAAAPYHQQQSAANSSLGISQNGPQSGMFQTTPASETGVASQQYSAPQSVGLPPSGGTNEIPQESQQPDQSVNNSINLSAFFDEEPIGQTPIGNASKGASLNDLF